MAVLTIEGGAKQLRIILKGNRTRIRRHGLKATFTEEKQEVEKSAPVKNEPKKETKKKVSSKDK
jgi:hypothetical protein